MALAEPLSFDLVVATVDRTAELGRLLGSLERQTHPAFRIVLVDQNDDDRLAQVIESHGSVQIDHIHAKRGLSHARNAGLGRLSADVIAFPDDDCTYPDDLLERVAHRFTADPSLGGLTGRAADVSGRSSPSWPLAPTDVTRENMWNRAISFTIFLRASVVGAVGRFDEELGLGSERPWSSGEETEYLVRAVDAGARIEYDPDLVVLHDEKAYTPADLRIAGAREGASVGYILRKHRYPPVTVARMLIRPAGGAALALARRDRAGAGFHLSTLRGRLRGYRS